MKSFIKDGWTFNQYPRDMDLFSLPSERVAENSTIYVDRVQIANSPGLTREVFFVSGKNGDEFGQYKTKIEALEKYNKVAKGGLK